MSKKSQMALEARLNALTREHNRKDKTVERLLLLFVVFVIALTGFILVTDDAPKDKAGALIFRGL